MGYVSQAEVTQKQKQKERRQSNQSDKIEHCLATEQNVVLQNIVRQKDV